MKNFYFLVSGLIIGAAMSAFLALEYVGKNSFAETNLADFVSTPRLILLAPPTLGVIVAIVGMKFAAEQQFTAAICFMVGSLVGLIESIAIFWLSPFPHHGFLFHAFNGIIVGGAVGYVTPLIALRLQRHS